jgi:sensor histidine kinase YesM
MVYDSNHDLVPLEKEIDYMQNYISLEKLRLNEFIPITFEVEGDPIQKKIAPLLLIPFLENAFKHGVSNSNPNSWVKAKLKTQGHHLHFEVTNSRLVQQGTAGASNSGIGLENVKKRLDLKYPGLYDLKIGSSDNQFSANLDIQLN